VDACEAFSCEPWVGVYAETSQSADLYLTSLKNCDEKKYLGREGKAVEDWKMGPNYKEGYEKDPDVKHIRIDFHRTNWSW
jgi:hypothetical protein